VTFRTSGVVVTTFRVSIPQVDNFVDKSPREASSAIKGGSFRPAA